MGTPVAPWVTHAWSLSWRSRHQAGAAIPLEVVSKPARRDNKKGILLQSERQRLRGSQSQRWAFAVGVSVKAAPGVFHRTKASLGRRRGALPRARWWEQ